MNNNNILRCYVEKKSGFDVAAKAVQAELAEFLELKNPVDIEVRLFNCYDVQGVPSEHLKKVYNTVISEPVCDNIYEENLPDLAGKGDVRVLYVEPLPGQFDIRADSCEQCIQMLLSDSDDAIRPKVKIAKVYVIWGIVDDAEFERVKSYLINKVEERETNSDKPQSLLEEANTNIPDIPEVHEDDYDGLSLAMSKDDVAVVREYFKSEKRNPTLAEIKVLDTYWSDHCRHTTFTTILKNIDIQDKRVKDAFELFKSINGDKPVTLMNIATAAMRHFRKEGSLPMLYESKSDENNACTIRVPCEGSDDDTLLFFKNETHNHPTEIEPLGGASTCIGGAIRDPLSGRAYVYQAMRITGSADPRVSINETLPGKLPQRKITTTAAEGFSSYGNQIGLATGFVKELYHPGYVAKRLEVGAVIGSAKESHVRCEKPAPGDIVVVMGGRTGRDGIGGATGSSRVHGESTVSESAAEVQKGNAPEERKLQRLFLKREVTQLIKKCNDFGAGGASVAIGELADGIEIDLDALPVKYQGLNGVELAISESQERMAVVIAESDLPELLKHCESENVEALKAAVITQEPRLVMKWRGKKIVDIARDFLDTNGAKRYADVKVPDIYKKEARPSDSEHFALHELNSFPQKGLVQRFDSSIGSKSVFSPFGGKFEMCESQVMASLIPDTGEGDKAKASVMSYGFDPYITEADPFGGAQRAVFDSVMKLVATGVELESIHLSLQEYFPRVNDCPERWGVVFSAMLGAFAAQAQLGIAAIGGKDSMSGSFGELDVPPTLISFAVGVGKAAKLVSNEFKKPNSYVYATTMDWEQIQSYLKLVKDDKILSACMFERFSCLANMSLGNMVGFKGELGMQEMLKYIGGIVFETSEKLEDFVLLGRTQKSLEYNGVSLENLQQRFDSQLEDVFPLQVEQPGEAPLITYTNTFDCNLLKSPTPLTGGVKPKAVIPVFPGTNCEFDTEFAFQKAGGEAQQVLVRNLTPVLLQESVAALEKSIKESQILIFPGGFSGGDEPDGSGKFIVSLFRNPKLVEAVHELLYKRDGLILGICNGFQALVKLGLLPDGKILQTENEIVARNATLTYNRIGRHQARYVRTRVSAVNSPWLSKCEIGEIYIQPISHGEGRFTTSPEVLKNLEEKGQIAFQYVNYGGLPSMHVNHNPNGSDWAIEGISSADGRILGKMAHSERVGQFVAKNIPGEKFLPIFEGGVNYYRFSS
ncbi:MAG: phosphoribosylformylglycinamidine synthase [Oscillospiraceae bacterium]|nr:phosphoribosylformylglycinamidine synthase [Oscillospiraceae bacterium]